MCSEPSQVGFANVGHLGAGQGETGGYGARRAEEGECGGREEGQWEYGPEEWGEDWQEGTEGSVEYWLRGLVDHTREVFRG